LREHQTQSTKTNEGVARGFVKWRIKNLDKRKLTACHDLWHLESHKQELEADIIFCENCTGENILYIFTNKIKGK